MTGVKTIHDESIKCRPRIWSQSIQLPDWPLRHTVGIVLRLAWTAFGTSSTACQFLLEGRTVSKHRVENANPLPVQECHCKRAAHAHLRITCSDSLSAFVVGASEAAMVPHARRRRPFVQCRPSVWPVIGGRHWRWPQPKADVSLVAQLGTGARPLGSQTATSWICQAGILWGRRHFRMRVAHGPCLKGILHFLFMACASESLRSAGSILLPRALAPAQASLPTAGTTRLRAKLQFARAFM